MPKFVENPDVAAVALASLVKMVSLLGAELVVGIHNDDIDLIETCIRSKLYASVPGVSQEDTAAGVALAHRLVEPVLRDLRARVEARARQQADARKEADAEVGGEIKKPSRSRSAPRLN